jgi:hypothetical protein
MQGGPRNHLPPYPDGSKRREYRCRRTADRPGCGKTHIDALPDELAVDEAMRARLGDPRRAAKMAAHLSKVSERRTKIERQLTTLQDSADELATKTAVWGVDRVDKAMTPLLRKIDSFQAELSTLDAPSQAEASASDAVDAWTTPDSGETCRLCAP